MFTIKHITLSDQEFLYESEHVRFEPHGLQNGTHDRPSDPKVAVGLGTNEVYLTGGTVFVMNSAGKTVSRYDLGASNVPIVGDGLADTRPLGLARVQADLVNPRN